MTHLNKKNVVVFATKSMNYLGRRNRWLGLLFVAFLKIIPGRVSYSLIAQYLAKYFKTKISYFFFDRAWSDLSGGEDWMMPSLGAFFELQITLKDAEKIQQVASLPWPSEVRENYSLISRHYQLCTDNSEFFKLIFNGNFLYCKGPIPLIQVREAAMRTTEIFPESTFSFSDPETFEPTPRQPHQVSLPGAFLYQLENAEVVGAFQVLQNEKFVCYEPAAKPERFLVAGVWRHFGLVENQGKEYIIGFRRPVHQVLRAKNGILLSGRATENYFHWMVEYIPKLYNVEKAGLNESVPLIVKSGLHPNFLQALRAITQRPLIEMDPDLERLAVGELYIPSTHTYHPDDFRSPYWVGGALSHVHLQFVREEILKNLNIQPVKPFRRIYIQRPARAARALGNAKDVLNFFEKQGFEIVRPEGLNFKQQVQLFFESEIICGTAGAGFSNLIFCQPGSVGIGFVSERNKDYCMYANLADFAGMRFINFTGDYVLPKAFYSLDDELAHAPFSISLKKMKKLLAQLESRSQ